MIQFTPTQLAIFALGMIQVGASLMLMILMLLDYPSRKA